jgi:EVE domain
MSADGPKTWILTGSLENFRINVERGFDVIGFKERRRRQAEEFEPGDEVFFYVTGVQAFGGLARVRSEMFEDRTRIWPGVKKGARASGSGKKPKREPYPWRVEAEPLLVLGEDDFVPAEALVGDLEHVSKWPLDHWHLAFQGQLRTIGKADAKLLRDRLSAAVPDRAKRLTSEAPVRA